VAKQTGDSTALMYIGFKIDVMTPSQFSDYLTRVIQPKLQTVGVVAHAQMLRGQAFAMRVWLNPQRMAALKITPADVQAALAANNFIAAPGQIKGAYTKTNISAETGAESVEAFEQLVVASRDDTLISLGQIA